MSEMDPQLDQCTSPTELTDHGDDRAFRTKNMNLGQRRRSGGWGLYRAKDPTPTKRQKLGFAEPLGFFDRGSRGTAKLTSKDVRKALKELYKYSDCPLELDKGQIRLLILLPNTDPEAKLVVELKAFSMQHLIDNQEDYPYTALSYTWGKHKADMEVSIRNEIRSGVSMADVADVMRHGPYKRLFIKPNLHEALRQFRQAQEPIALWVDAICINQMSNEEKKDQVSRMSMIYSTAANVSIWLGPSDDDTDRAMVFIDKILEGASQFSEFLKPTFAEDWAKLFWLMRKEWFSRRWVIQELALARVAEVRCGATTKNWKDFSDAVSLLVLNFDRIIRYIRQAPEIAAKVEGIHDVAPFGARVLVDVLANAFLRSSDGTIYATRQGLESLISSMSAFETSDPRDTVYTLLNLASETCNIPTINMDESTRRNPENTVKRPEPDYGLDLFQTYSNFVEWIVNENKSLDILCRHWALPELTQKLDDHYPRLCVLPSWIKTVDKSTYGSAKLGFGGGRMTGDSFVGNPDTRSYNASKGRFPTIEFGRDPKQKPPRPRPASDHERFKRTRSMYDLNPSALYRSRGVVWDYSFSITVKGMWLGDVTKTITMDEGVIPASVLNSLGHNPEQEEFRTVSDSVWRTLVADRGPDGRQPPAWYHRACLMCLAEDTRAGSLDTKDIIRRDDRLNVKSQDDKPTIKSQFLKRVQGVCWNRSYIESNGARLLVGIGPYDTSMQPSDQICILFGCSVPVILRPYWSGSQDPKTPPRHYHLVGEAFILGMMDGEAMVGLREDRYEDLTIL